VPNDQPDAPRRDEVPKPDGAPPRGPVLSPTTQAAAPVSATTGVPRGFGLLREIKALLAAPGSGPMVRRIALLTAGLVAVIVCNMVGQLRLNTWNGDFYDALEDKNLAVFGQQLLVFLAIVAALLVLVVAQTWFHEMLKVRVREWLTHRILGEWLVPGRAYRLGLTSDLGVNPDQRIQEDARQLTELTTQLGTGLLQATLMLVSFVGVLWALSDQVVFSWKGEPLVVPGYMVWCALAYAGIGSILTWFVGRPLIRLNAERFQRESELRFALVRFSENADTIALQRGEGAERLVLDRNLGNVVEAMRRVALGLVRLTWVTSGYGWIAIVLPIVVASPGYFGGELSLGGLMMVVGAFNQVQGAMRWFVDSFAAIANWRAAMVRVALLREALHRTDERDVARERLSVEETADDSLSLDGVQVAIPGDGIATCEPSVDIRPGDRVFLSGGSGSGKSTLLKAIAGLWRWGEGRVRRPARSAIMFMPHHPYLPLGTLRAAVAYPGLPDAFADAEVAAALRRVGLARLVPLLDRAERWDRALSGGEQQRLAFARLLLHRPRWVFMDDPAAGLDAEERRRVMSIFDDELAGSAVISVGSPPDGAAMPRLKTLCLTQTPAPASA